MLWKIQQTHETLYQKLQIILSNLVPHWSALVNMPTLPGSLLYFSFTSTMFVNAFRRPHMQRDEIHFLKAYGRSRIFKIFRILLQFVLFE